MKAEKYQPTAIRHQWDNGSKKEKKKRLVCLKWSDNLTTAMRWRVSWNIQQMFCRKGKISWHWRTPVNHEGAEHNVRQHVTMAYLSFLSSTMSLFWKDQFLFIYTRWTVWIHFRKCNTFDFFLVLICDLKSFSCWLYISTSVTPIKLHLFARIIIQRYSVCPQMIYSASLFPHFCSVTAFLQNWFN